MESLQTQDQEKCGTRDNGSEESVTSPDDNNETMNARHSEDVVNSANSAPAGAPPSLTADPDKNAAEDTDSKGKANNSIIDEDDDDYEGDVGSNTNNVENQTPRDDAENSAAATTPQDDSTIESLQHALQASSIQAHFEDPDLNLHSVTGSVDGAASSRFAAPNTMPGPVREEPTLKEALIDRERQRRKEAERARLKRQFALMSNGGGMVWDSQQQQNTTQNMLQNGSVAGTVGEESIRSIPTYLEESAHGNDEHHSQGINQSPQQQLGYTMERFLQERDTTAPRITTNITQVATVAAGGSADSIASSDHSDQPNNDVIREEAIEGDPATAGAPDKGVVMERFLNEPVVVAPSAADDDGDKFFMRPDDVHRSVSFDMELRTAQYNEFNANQNDTMLEDASGTASLGRNALVDDHRLHRHPSVDDSNMSVRVEIAPEDDLAILADPISSGGPMSSVPSEGNFSSLINRHRSGLEANTSLLGSVGPSMDDNQSAVSNNTNRDDSSTLEEPRVFRLTEAEIQEMAAIEEASIGNGPPSERDAESLVGDLVGEFGGRSATDADRGPAGTTYSQGTPTTAMESGSMLSGALRSTADDRLQGRDDRVVHNADAHLDGMNDHHSIDDLARAPSLSSHLVISPGGSVSDSAASVAGNPPSEIIERGGPTPALSLDDDEITNTHHSDNDLTSPLPPPPVLVGSPNGSRHSPSLGVAEGTTIHAGGEDNQDRADRIPSLVPRTLPLPRPECKNSAAIRAELNTTGPPAEGIVNRRLRPGMPTKNAHRSPISSPMRRIVSMPENINTPGNNRIVDEFDFDKHDHDMPMTPRSMLSDSIRDLPGDDLWTSPGTKMMSTPSHPENSRANQQRERDSNFDPLLLPAMSKDKREVPSYADISKLDCVLRDVQIGISATVEAKEAEIYSRAPIMLKSESIKSCLACCLFLSLFTP